jgi:hypothetical protein
MKINSKKVAELSEKTSFSYRKCEKILRECEDDEQAAYERLKEMRNNPIDVIADSFVAILRENAEISLLFMTKTNKCFLFRRFFRFFFW